MKKSYHSNTVPADEAARTADEREAVTVSAATDSYESVYGADDLDIPDFLK